MHGFYFQLLAKQFIQRLKYYFTKVYFHSLFVNVNVTLSNLTSTLSLIWPNHNRKLVLIHFLLFATLLNKLYFKHCFICLYFKEKDYFLCGLA